MKYTSSLEQAGAAGSIHPWPPPGRTKSEVAAEGSGYLGGENVNQGVL